LAFDSQNAIGTYCEQASRERASHVVAVDGAYLAGVPNLERRRTMSSPILRRCGRTTLAALALLALSGCVAYPGYGYAGYPGYPYAGYGYPAYAYPAYAYAGPPVVVGGGWWGWRGGWRR
jgi:hypothetical protein